MFVQETDSSFAEIIHHYLAAWENEPNFYFFDKGPIEKLPYNFRVLEFAPTASRSMWTYATCCMSLPSDPEPMELHIFSPVKDHRFIELLTAIAYYHHNNRKLGLHHSFNFGSSLFEHSLCKHGYISAPYLDGPGLENLMLKEIDINIKFYWIIPITEAELKYKKQYGALALEGKLESAKVDYTNFLRASTV
ncbi:MAG: suppressor of fused domain protein [Bacteroidetes bacterium]|nr:suppressor of fused domain protein [Bacteroidota bacterium]